VAGLADIFNLALGYVGVNEHVTDPTATNNTCKTLNRFWPLARDMVLRDFPWACARKTRAAALRDQEVPGWTYTYDYPDDAIFVLAVMPETGVRSPTIWRECWEAHTALRPPRYPFDRMLREDGRGQVIACDLPEAYLLYIARVTNVGVYDIGLVSTAAAKLAHLSAASFQVKADIVRLAADTYEVERAKATANDFNEGHPDAEPETPSIAVRG
jgi:hypothetical protein